MKKNYIDFESLEADLIELTKILAGQVSYDYSVFDMNFELDYYDESIYIRLRKIPFRKYLPATNKHNLVLELIFKYVTNKNNIVRHNVKRKLRKLGIIIA